MNRNEIRSVLPVLAFSVVIGGVCYAAESGDVMSWDNVLAAVQKTVPDNAVRHQFGTVKDEMESSAAVYEAKITNADSSRPVIKAAEDGTPMSMKTGKVYPGQNMEKDAAD